MTAPVTRRAVIHIGLPKCGSSALQTRLVSNQPNLLAHGVFYPSPHDAEKLRPDAADEMPMGHMTMAKELLTASRDGRPIDPSRTLLASYVGEFEASGATTLALSSESLADRFRKIRPELLAPLGSLAIEVLLLFRRADSYTLATYKQRVRRRRVRQTFAEFIEDFAGDWADSRTDLPAVLDGIVARFPEATLHIHDLDDPDGTRDSIAIASRILGVPLGDWPTIAVHDRNAVLVATGQPVNVSYSDEKTLFLLECNRSPLGDAALGEIDIALAKVPDPAADDHVLMSRQQSRTLLRRFARLNTYRATRYGHRLVDHQVDKRLPREITSEPTLATNRRTTLIAQLLPLLSPATGAELSAALAGA